MYVKTDKWWEYIDKKRLISSLSKLLVKAKEGTLMSRFKANLLSAMNLDDAVGKQQELQSPSSGPLILPRRKNFRPGS